MICLNTLSVPCGHNFCKFCLERSLLEKQNCPICRTDLPFINQQNLRVNIILSDLFSKLFPKEYSERKVEVEEEVKEFRSTKIIRKKLYYGNMHRLHSTRQDDQTAWHKWKCFVRIENSTSPAENSEFIKSVEFHLHPTFTPPVVKITRPPFEVERLGWGWFYIKVCIYKQIF